MKLRIALAAGLFVLLGVWASTAITLGIVESAARARLVAEQQDAAQRTASQLAERIRDRQLTLAAFARRLPPDIADQTTVATRILSVDLLPATGFRSTFIATADGVVVAQASNGSVTLGQVSVADRDYFREVSRTGRIALSHPLRGRTTTEPVIVMAAPVLGESGDTTAVVGATLALTGTEGLGAFASRVNPTTHTIVVDRLRGEVIGHEDAGRLLQPITAVTELVPVLSRLAETTGGDARMGADRFGSSTIGWAAVDGTPWMVFELSDTESLFAAMRYTQASAIGANVLLSAVAAVLMLLILSRLFRPMTQLGERALRVLTSPDDMEAGWPQGTHEVGELGRVLQHVLRERMAAEVQGTQMIGRLQAVMDTASVGIAFSRDDRFEIVSRTLANLTGYSVRELTGVPIKILQVSEAGWERLKAMVDATRGRFDVEFPIRRKDGSKLWVRTVGSAIDPSAPDDGMVWIVEDATESRRLREQLLWSASRDPLTELLNRRAFESRLADHLGDPNRTEAALLILDLDRFKAVNDLGGHAAGDRLLCDIARRMEGLVRRSDHVGRLGGDEFAVLLTGCARDVAVDTAQRIRRAIAACRLTLEGGDASVGVSIGVVHIDGRFAASAEVLRAADQACYEAKRAGRDAVHTWTAAGVLTEPAVAHASATATATATAAATAAATGR